MHETRKYCIDPFPFPFAEGNAEKLRPALVAALTRDKYQDLILCAISSVVRPDSDNNQFEILLEPVSTNGLRRPSVLKVDRVVTLKASDVVLSLGKLSPDEWKTFCAALKKLVD